MLLSFSCLMSTSIGKDHVAETTDYPIAPELILRLDMSLSILEVTHGFDASSHATTSFAMSKNGTGCLGTVNLPFATRCTTIFMLNSNFKAVCCCSMSLRATRMVVLTPSAVLIKSWAGLDTEL
jgi:hypothetical protein